VQLRAGLDEAADDGSGVRQMLVVVQGYQEPSVGDAVHHGLHERHGGRAADVERLLERGDDMLGSTSGASATNTAPIGGTATATTRPRAETTVYLHGEPGLTRPGWAEDADQALAGQQASEFSQLTFPAYE
jgi:hypothetical protein